MSQSDDLCFYPHLRDVFCCLLSKRSVLSTKLPSCDQFILSSIFKMSGREASRKISVAFCSAVVGLSSAVKTYYQVFVGWMYPEGWSVCLHVREAQVNT